MARDRKDDAASRAGRALGEAVNVLFAKAAWRERRCDAILDAYIRSGRTGRSYEDERKALFRERGLGELDD